MAQRDAYRSGRRDKHRKLTTLRAREQREQEEQFRRLEMLQQPKSVARADADMAKLAARLTIAEANIAELMDNPVPKDGGMAWGMGALVIIVIGVVAVAAVIARFHL